ncbi:MAG: DNA recombination protein RmuC [Alistipes senegalensis]|nr:DNA recombination protein RmuC [Bacteroides cellulosilyticus]MCM1352328.1 DNA recombination protein RmuC [Alistipes senegalensis]
MESIYIGITVVLGAVSAVLGAALYFQRSEKERLRNEKTAADETRIAAEAEIRRLLEEHARTTAELAALKAASEAEIAAMRRKTDEQREAERQEREKNEETLRLQFRNLANEILGEQSQHLRKTNSDAIELLIKPFRDNLTDFRKRVEEIYTVQTSQRGELKAELKNLMELNHRITAETVNLTNALKGNSKVQGDWGEMLLETILDSSALTKGIHYETQYNVKDEEGRNLRPDVVLRLPEKKEIVIDSKVSLTAFVAYTSATDEAERQRHLAAHVASVRQHVTELGRKDYQRQFNSPDFVILFIPNEPAFLEALKADSAIWSDAYDKKVIISSPTNLFALLKLVADLWKYHAQDKNTREIATCALKLYEQAAAFSTSLEGVGAALDKARDAYEDARKRLCTGNDNIVRVGMRLQKTARLQSKKQFSARMLDEAGSEMPEEDVLPTGNDDTEN